MGDLALVVLTANSKDGAAKALDAARKLDRDGWIEMMDYGLIRKDEKGRIATREMDDDLSEKVAAASVGVAGGFVGAAAGGPVGGGCRRCRGSVDWIRINAAHGKCRARHASRGISGRPRC